MRFCVETKSRDDFIGFGRALGEAFMPGIEREKSSYIVAIDGDENTGKSLIALAIDTAFRPEFYPEGITKNLSADDLYPEADKNAYFPVSFGNFKNFIYIEKDDLDARLSNFSNSCKNSKVIVASNIQRSFTGDFNYASQGLDSDLMDIHIAVNVLNGDFRRKMDITVEDRDLITRLKTVLPQLVAA